MDSSRRLARDDGVPDSEPSVATGGKLYRDGALLANNPSIEAVLEVSKLWPGRPIAFVHSVGVDGLNSLTEVRGPAGGKISLSHELSSVVETLGHTGAAKKHAESVLSLLHPRAQYRRVHLPLAHYCPFVAEEALYRKIGGICQAPGDVQRLSGNAP